MKSLKHPWNEVRNTNERVSFNNIFINHLKVNTMVEFEVKSKKQTIGKKKGQTVYYAVPKSNQHMTLDALCDMIMDETSLSRGDVMNTLITLGKMACRSLKMGASIDLGDLGSLRVYFPPKMMDDMKDVTDVTAATLKTPKIIFTPKAKMREAAHAAEVSVDNPARKKEKSLTPDPEPKEKENKEENGPVAG